MASRDQEIRLHHQKWKRWKMEMKDGSNGATMTKKEKEVPVESASTYAAKIMDKLEEPGKSSCPISNKFEKEFESNACSVCYELMIPPRNPITLFPCAHNMCKVCLYVDGHKKLKSYTLKTKKCGLCPSTIVNHAENRSLMNLICTYTNNKHLIQKQENQEIESPLDKTDSFGVDRLKMRCEILEKEKKSVMLALAKEKKNKEVLGEVLGKLLEERKKNAKETQALEEQTKLIENFLKQKREELEKIKSRIATTEQKKRVVEKTLEPLRTQKQKLQILQAAKLMQK